MDALHIYGLARAGFVPQLFSLRLPTPDVVFELMERAHAQALIYDASYASAMHKCPTAAAIAIDIHSVEVPAAALPALDEAMDADDIVMIFHTSGSTSGSPKLVPCNRRWLDTTVKKANSTTRPVSADRRDVTVWM